MIHRCLAEVKIPSLAQWWFSTSPSGGFRPELVQPALFANCELEADCHPIIALQRRTEWKPALHLNKGGPLGLCRGQSQVRKYDHHHLSACITTQNSTRPIPSARFGINSQVVF